MTQEGKEIITNALNAVDQSRVLVQLSSEELEEVKQELIKMGIYITGEN